MAPMTAMVMKPPTWRLDWPNNVVSGGVSTAMTCSEPECVWQGGGQEQVAFSWNIIIRLKASICW